MRISVVLDLGQTRQSSVSGQCGSKGQCTDGPVSGAHQTGAGHLGLNRMGLKFATKTIPAFVEHL